MTAPQRPGHLRRFIASILVCLPAAACQPLQTGGDGVEAGARPTADASVSLDQAEAIAHRQLGLGLESAGDIAGAVEEYSTALGLGRWPAAPSTGGIDESPKGDLARICARRDPAAEIIRACNRAIGAASFDSDRLAELFANRADTYLRLGDHDRALADYETVLKINTNDPRGLFGRGRMRARAGDHRLAILDFDRVISAAPDLLEVRFARALSRAELGDFEAAIADYDHVLTDPAALAAHPDVYRRRARMYCRAGEADAAAIDWQVWLAATSGGAGYVQEMLWAHGYLRGAPGPEFDATTLAALRAWTRAGCPDG